MIIVKLKQIKEQTHCLAFFKGVLVRKKIFDLKTLESSIIYSFH